MSRRDANEVKKDERITVVIGNPPYKEKAKGRGGWIENGSGGKLVAPLDRWRPPPEWGVGAHVKHLKNLYVYFWRWATWKVFGSGTTQQPAIPTKTMKVSSASSRSPVSKRPRLREDARRSAADCSRNLGHRLLAGRTSTGSADTDFSRRAAAGLHRACGPQARTRAQMSRRRCGSALFRQGARGEIQSAWRSFLLTKNGGMMFVTLARSVSARRKRTLGELSGAQRLFCIRRSRRDARANLGRRARQYRRSGSVGPD